MGGCRLFEISVRGESLNKRAIESCFMVEWERRAGAMPSRERVQEHPRSHTYVDRGHWSLRRLRGRGRDVAYRLPYSLRLQSTYPKARRVSRVRWSRPDQDNAGCRRSSRSTEGR